MRKQKWENVIARRPEAQKLSFSETAASFAHNGLCLFPLLTGQKVLFIKTFFTEKFFTQKMQFFAKKKTKKEGRVLEKSTEKTGTDF